MFQNLCVLVNMLENRLKIYVRNLTKKISYSSLKNYKMEGNTERKKNLKD